MLKTNQLSFQYQGNETQFSFPNIFCESKETLLVLGKSGVGKTTLLHLLGGLLVPTQGEIWIKDTNLSTLRGSALDRFRGQHIGMVFQQPHFIQSLTVAENLNLAQSVAHKKVDKTRTQNLLAQLDIAHRAQARAQDMSIGEQQRANIARALINQPSLLLADEPTSALDDENCELVIQLLEQQAIAHNVALVIVTHDTRLKAYFKHHIEL
jgi:putative ABC transport system ATP-binding protein